MNSLQYLENSIGLTWGDEVPAPYEKEQIAYLKQVAARIRTLRVAKGYSQEAMALQIKMDRSFYGRVERGEKNLSLLKMKLIADALGLTPAQLLDIQGELK